MTVIVVLAGAWPYVFVLRKLVGSYDSPILSIELFNPRPTFFILGIINSSDKELSPPPKLIDVVKSSFTLVVNLLLVFNNLSKYGTVSLN